MKKFLSGNRSSALYSKCFEMGKWQNTFLLWKDAPSVGGLWVVVGGESSLGTLLAKKMKPKGS